jgi:hypothetical protein
MLSQISSINDRRCSVFSWSIPNFFIAPDMTRSLHLLLAHAK